MPSFDNIYRKILNDLRVELKEEFDRNFERKAFFTDPPWAPVKYPARRGSLMMRSPGGLRSSIMAKVIADGVQFTSSKPYADIHNEGGRIKVTPQIKKYFWAMYYKATGGITYSIKTKQANKTKRNKMLNAEAQYWKNMALMKVGTDITIPERRFIGRSPEVDQLIQNVIDDNMKELNQTLITQFKKQ